MPLTTSNGRKLLPTKDMSLKKFVEEYLMSNQDLVYINMEEMTSAIQKRSYRFSRMKRQAFAEMVQQAYFSYCNEKFQNPHVFAVDENPNGDIEIEDAPPRSTMNNQLKGLYTVGIPSTNSTSSEKVYTIGAGRGRFTGEELEVASKIAATKRKSKPTKSSEPEEQEPDPPELDVPPIPNSSQSYEEEGSSRIIAIPQYWRRKRADSESILKDDEDDDLQIIHEGPAERSSVPASTSGSACSNVGTPGGNTSIGNANSDQSAIPSTQSEDPGRCGSTGSGLTLQARTTRKVPAPAASAGDRVVNTTPKPRVPKRKLEEDIVPASSSKQLPALRNHRPMEVRDAEEPFNKSKKREVSIQHSNYTFSDFGGSEKLLEEVCKLLMHLKHPEMYRTLGVTPPRGFLLHGPPGVGKTLLAQAIAGELKLPILKMAATELISGISGESESNIRSVFEQALAVAPCIIFMDEIDSITPKRENASKEMERRIVAQLLSCIDDLVTKPKGDQVLLIGATSRIEAIDSALRRAGRFDREICLGIPNESAREKIIRVISRGLKLEANFDFNFLAKLTPGYVGADLHALVREAAVQAVTEILNSKTVPSSLPSSVSPMETEQTAGSEVEALDINVITLDSPNPGTASVPVDVEVVGADVPKPDQSFSAVQHQVATSSQNKWITETAPLSESDLENFCITMKDFEKAHKYVQPSAKREGFATVPDTTWDDIGALQDIRDELQVSILGPVKYSSAFEVLGLNAPAGVLLCGPPGCGKTLLAKAVANEAGINFISVKGPELLNMYVGESERAVRQCFQRAKNSAPCVIFFDELDSLCPRRSDGVESGSSSRIVNQLLTEMDGMEGRLGVFVMGATNRPDIIDPAILRPGRLDKILFVNLPTPAERVEILKAVTKNGTLPKFAEDVNIEEIGMSDECKNYTGADLASLVREAGIAAFRELVLAKYSQSGEQCPEKDLKIYSRHFQKAFSNTKPSVSAKDRMKYEKMKEEHSILAGLKKEPS